jgi:DNA-binding MarR family transcriptional regulator
MGKSGRGEPGPPPKALLKSTGYLLARLGAESRRLFDAALETTNLRLSHYTLLIFLESGPLSQAELGAAAGVDPRNLVTLLDHLEAKGVIGRVEDPADRRRHSVTLTKAGGATLRAVRRAGADAEASLLGPLSPAERRSLHRLLLKLMASGSQE